MSKYLAVALGGMIGAIARYALGGFITERSSSAFPWGTFVINITGSFIIGFFLTFISEHVTLNPHWRLAIAVGFVGAYTTFSTFEYETLKLIEDGKVSISLFYVMVSLLVGFFAVWGGAVMARQLGTKAISAYRASQPSVAIAQVDTFEPKLKSEDSKGS